MQSIANSVSTLQAAKVLRLPEEIMQNIAKHFTLAEWVQGPAQTCHLLHRMKLPRVDLKCSKVGDKVRPEIEPSLLQLLCYVFLTTHIRQGNMQQPALQNLLRVAPIRSFAIISLCGNPVCCPGHLPASDK